MRFVNMLALVLLLAPGPAMADFILLDANFDDKVIDDPIGLGGPDVGEPLSVNSDLSAIVRDAPFATPSLEIVRNAEASTGYVVFEFVGSASVDVGNVRLSVDVIFHTLDAFNIIDVREQGVWSSAFCKIYTDGSGNLRLSDAVGYYGIIGTYVAGQLYQFQVDFDTVADTYDVLLDGTPLVEGRYHGKTGVGIGRQAFAVSHVAAVGSGYYVDSLLITADEYTATEISSFSSVKNLY